MSGTAYNNHLLSLDRLTSSHCSSSSSSSHPNQVPSVFASLGPDVGLCIAHYMFIHELATFACVSKDTLTLVQRKMEQFKILDLTLYPFISQRRFELLCTIVTGLESLVFPLAGLAPRALLAGSTVSVEPITPSSSTYWRIYRTFAQCLLALVERNAMTLRVIQVKAPNPMLTPRADSHKQYHKLLLLPLFRRVATMPCIEVFHQRDVLMVDAHGTLAGQYSLKSNPLFDPSSTIRRQFSMAARSLPTFFPKLEVMSGILYPSLYLHRILPQFPSHIKSLRLCFPWHQMIGTEEQADHIRDLLHYQPLAPLDLTLPDEVQAEGAAAMTKSVSIERLNMVLQYFRSLMYLSLQLFESYVPHSVLKLGLPHLLQLGIDCDVDAHIGDIQFDCPSLLSLNLHVEMLVDQEEALRRVARRAAQEEEDDEQELDYYCLPPTILASLSKSPRLQFICLPLCATDAEFSMPNIRTNMSKVMIDAISHKAHELNRSNPLDSLDEPDMDLSERTRVRLLLYAISTLPFAPYLQLFEDNSPLVPLAEYFSLFPSLGSFSSDPDFQEPSAEYFRPPQECYPLGIEYWAETIVNEKKLGWDRLHHDHNPYIRSTPSDSTDDSSHVSSSTWLMTQDRVRHYFSLAHKDARCTIEELPQAILDRFTTLSVLYLSAPTLVHTDAIRQLITTCTQLESLSLIQLDGIDDSVFLFPNGGFVRPRLKMLRLKNICRPLNATDKEPLTVQSVIRASTIFPNLTTLDLVQFPCVPVYDSMKLLLERGRFRQLHTLTIPISDSDDEESNAHLRAFKHVFMDIARSSQSTGAEFILQLISLTEPAEGFVEDGQWFRHRRTIHRHSVEVINSSTRATFGMRYFEEASCFADICPYHISGAGENNPDLMNGDVDLDIPDGIPPDFDQVPDQPIIQLPQLGEEESEEDDYEDGLEQQLVAQQMMDEEIHPNANNQADNEDDPFAVHSSEADQRAEFSPQALVVIHDPLSSSEDEHENNAVNGENYEEEAKGSAKLTPEPGA